MTNKGKSVLNMILTIRIGKYIRLNTSTVILFVSSVIFNYQYLFLIAYISSLLHELGHIFTAKKLKITINYIVIQPFGIMAKLSDAYIKEPVKEIIISGAGPFVSLVLSVFFAIINLQFPNFNIDYAAKLNAALFLINIIPCLPLDGGRIMKSLIAEKYGILSAYNFMTKSSGIILTILTLIGGILIITQNFNLSFILILAFLLGNLTTEYKAVNLIAMKEIIYNKEKLCKNNLIKVKNIAAYNNVSARAILKNLSYNYYCIIDVIDKNHNITNRITESRIIDEITKNGISIKLGDIN